MSNTSNAIDANWGHIIGMTKNYLLELTLATR